MSVWIIPSRAICVALAVCLFGPAAQAETLRDAMREAYRQSPALKAERARQRATNQGVWQARSAFLPRVSGSYGVERRDYRDHLNATDNDRFEHNLEITAEQTLFQGFAGVNRLNQAHEESAAGQERLLGAEQDLLFGTGRTFLAVLRDRNNVAHRKSYLALVGEERRSAKRRVELGDASRTDVDQASARYNEAQADLEQALGQLAASDAAYQRLVGREPGKLAWPALPADLLPASLGAAIDIAMRGNPTVRSKVSEARASRFAARARVGDMLPRVTASASYLNEYRDSLATRSVEDFQVGVRVNVPIFTGGSNIASVRQAKETAAQREYEVDDTRLQVRESVIAAQKQMETSRRRAEAARQAISANERAVRGLKMEYRGGERTLLDVLNGQRELVDSRTVYENARFDRAVAELFLLATLGRLSPERFGVPAKVVAVPARLVPTMESWSLRLDKRD
ncbi:TolC family outer membrane protein [Stappia stellulata]|uniref:TolC family outer membrane protein n=1 Tax=Stappia stellulata TaxID=71235 RepID=UPI0004108B52|nr:TolC family outer membrane protein [Stappia stellulata]